MFFTDRLNQDKEAKLTVSPGSDSRVDDALTEIRHSNNFTVTFLKIICIYTHE